MKSKTDRQTDRDRERALEYGLMEKKKEKKRGGGRPRKRKALNGDEWENQGSPGGKNPD